MAFTTKEKTERTLSEINVTPLVDVILVLLIIFMITAPMMQSGVEVALPRTEIQPKESEERWIVAINQFRQVFINDTPVAPELLEERMRTLVYGVPHPAVHLRADRRLDYGYVLFILGKIKNAGVESVGLVTERIKEGSSEEPEAAR